MKNQTICNIDVFFQRIVNVLWFLQGYFHYTVMYYGGYSNATLHGLVEYDMQLAYFFTISAYMVLCGIALIFKLVHENVDDDILGLLHIPFATQVGSPLNAKKCT